MSKIKEFMAKPITWGGYLKFLGITSAISGATTVIIYRYTLHEMKKNHKFMDKRHIKS